MTEQGIPPGMRLLDGVPVPVEAGGATVRAVTRQGTDPGRTTLLLDNHRRVHGCVDCVFTAEHWQTTANHREADHGIPYPGRIRPRTDVAINARHGTVVATNGHKQLELETRLEPSAGSAQPKRPHAKRPAGDPQRLFQLPSQVITGMLQMTMDEVIATAASSYSAGKRIEDMGAALQEVSADRDLWRAKYRALEREVKKAGASLIKIGDALMTKGED